MDGDPAHFEIELTPTSERPRTARPEPSDGGPADRRPDDAGSDGPPAVSSGSTGPDGDRNTERSRLVTASLAVGVVGLVLGFVLGRAGAGTDDTSTDASSGTATEDRVDDDASDAPITGETLPEIAVATTDPPATTTTSALRTRVRVDLHPSARGLPIEIVGLSNGGELVLLDLSTGYRTETGIDIERSSGPRQVLVGDDWVLVPNWDSNTTYVIQGDGEPRPVDLGPAWQLFPATDGDTFWRLDEELMMGVEGSAVEVGIDGEPTGRVVSLPRQPSAPDPSGGFIVQEAGGAYRVGADGDVVRITDGEVISLDDAVVLAYECDVELSCVHVVIDRADGTRTELPVTDASADGEAFRLRAPWWYGAQRSLIAPDHSAAVVMRTRPELGAEVLGVLDLSSGDFVDLVENPSNPGGTTWSPDSRFLFYLDGVRLMMHDRESGDSVVVTSDRAMPSLAAFGLRGLGVG